jgi:hypothetical protein
MTVREVRLVGLIPSVVGAFTTPVIQDRAQLYPMEGWSCSIEAETCHSNKGPAKLKTAHHERLRKRDRESTDDNIAHVITPVMGYV